MRNLSVFLMLLLGSGLSLAQPASVPDEDKAGAAEETPTDTAESPAESVPPPLTGDVIRLKSGKVIAGAQVVRKGPTTLFVQILPGVAPLELPLSQIEAVEYDDIDPLQQRTIAPPAAPQAQPDYMQGKELSPELRKKLGATISETPLSIQQEDYIAVLTRVAERMNIPLTIGPKIQAMEPSARLWSAEIPAGTSFIVLLYEHLLRDFPRVKETYEYGQIQLTLRRPDDPGPGTAPPVFVPDAPLPADAAADTAVPQPSIEAPATPAEAPVTPPVAPVE